MVGIGFWSWVFAFFGVGLWEGRNLIGKKRFIIKNRCKLWDEGF